MRLSIDHNGVPVEVDIEAAVLGRATSVAQDTTSNLVFDGRGYVVPVNLAAGNWNLRSVVTAADGTTLRQRIIVET